MKTIRLRNKGFSSLLAVIFVTLFSVLAISFTAMSNINLQISENHRNMTLAQVTAESGLQYVNFLVTHYDPPQDAYSAHNTVSENEAVSTFNYFVDYVDSTIGGSWSGNVFVSNPIVYDNTAQASFVLEFDFLAGAEDEAHQLVVTSIGSHGGVSRAARLLYPIRKDAEVLEYAIAGNGRLWLTGDTVIHGDLYTTWDRTDVSPYNVTSESSVVGTLNTVLALNVIEDAGYYQLEWVDENGLPMFDEDGNRLYHEDDQVQGYHEGIKYGQTHPEMPGMDINDYDTSMYRDLVSAIPDSSTTQTEYFPHAPGDYQSPKPGYSEWVVNYYHMQMERHVYTNQTFTNSSLPADRNALFVNCTFEGVLMVEAGENGYNYNNVRFENCRFNGPIITAVPEPFNWIRNCLYFTAAAEFHNTVMEEATILAPHFNVNLGNTDPGVVENGNSELTGAIVGGIVDVRGNANIEGTIISMYDATSHSSGYVTNIGATLGDGGSETSEAGDIGVIRIKPSPDRLLPSGMKTPIVIGNADGDTYIELENYSCSN